MQDFDVIEQHCIDRFGSKKSLNRQLLVPKTAAELLAEDDSYYFSAMCRRVFRAGLKHSLVDAKWPAFETAFYQFQLVRVAMMSDEEQDDLMANAAIIRHWPKLKSVRTNASFLLEIVEQYNSIGEWLAGWPDEDIVGLWTFLKKQGAQLGGNSGAYFLRMVGKDTFVLTQDVVTALIAQGIVDKAPSSQKDLKAVQFAFNGWQSQSQRPLCQISQMLALTVNY